MPDFVVFEFINFLTAVPSVIPGGDYLSVPWNWFLELGTITKILVLIFGALGFYIVLRIFYKIIEAILALFH